VRNDRRAASLRPRAKAPRRRLVYALLHLGRVEEAARFAQQLVELDPDDPRSRRFERAVRVVASDPRPDARNRVLAALPLLASRQPLRQ
jgi:DNA-binding transcriptional regulator/RsmH inhibitor MraZ